MKRYLHLVTIWVTLLCLNACNKKGPSQQPSFKEAVDKKVWLLCDSLSKNYVYSSDSAGARRLLQQALQRFPDWRDSATHAWLLVQMSEIYGYSGPLDSVEKYCQEALPYFERHPDYLLPLNMCYSGIGFSLIHLHDDIYKANYYSTKAAALCLLPGADTVIPAGLALRSLTSATGSNRICHQFHQSNHFAREAYKRSFATRNTWQSSYLTSLLDMAQSFLNLDKADSALFYMKGAQHWLDTIKGEEQSKLTEYSWATYYYYTKQYDSSLHYSLDIGSDAPREHRFGYICNIALLYCLLDRQTEAKRYLDTAAELLPLIKSVAEKKGYIAAQTLYMTRYGERKAAAQSFLDYDEITANFYDAEQTRMSTSIEAEYNVADKQRNVDRLNRLNEHTQRALQAKNNLLVITGLVILLCAALILFLLLLSRQRRLRAAAQSAEADRRKVVLEQRLLRTQMEPHFIFNTMAAVQHFIHERKNEEAGIYLDHFARLLRNSLEHSREEYILLSEEVETLEHYISLQAMQSGYSFDYSIGIYEGYTEDEIRIPPMLLQPFVENAIQHGIGNIAYRGKIDITIEKENKLLVCSITDNGAGIGSAGVQQKKSLAMQITRERLEALSKETGQRASLDISDREQEGAQGTRVRITIPFL